MSLPLPLATPPAECTRAQPTRSSGCGGGERLKVHNLVLIHFACYLCILYLLYLYFLTRLSVIMFTQNCFILKFIKYC